MPIYIKNVKFDFIFITKRNKFDEYLVTNYVYELLSKSQQKHLESDIL